MSTNTSYPAITTGRILITLTAIAAPLGGFLADWSETHVFNPRWPPHAKFHNGQTLSMNVCGAVGAIYYAWRPVPPRNLLDSTRTALFFASLTYVTGMSAILYPGTKARDPEFGEGNQQVWAFGALFAVAVGGYWLEARRLVGRIA